MENKCETIDVLVTRIMTYIELHDGIYININIDNDDDIQLGDDGQIGLSFT